MPESHQDEATTGASQVQNHCVLYNMTLSQTQKQMCILFVPIYIYIQLQIREIIG